MTIAVGGDAMRLVHDDDVPTRVDDRAEHLRPLDEIDRHNDDGPRRPGVDVWRKVSGAPPDREGIDDRRRHVKTTMQLVLPLIAQAGRRLDQRAFRDAALTQLSDERAGLNGFSKADVIREQ